MRRAMLVADGLGPQEGNYYDHPHFGQLFLGGTLGITGYPDALNPDSSIKSMQNLYLVPRLLMGMLSIVDTFLVFKIAEKRYGRKVAIVASILFAVMPMTWLVRRILLDSILLPFLLGSILMAVYAKDSRHAGAFALASGVLLGLAVYTKIPAFVMMPLVGYLVYTSIKASKQRRARLLLYWIMPAILIPMLWPAQSILAGQFDSWKEDVLWQTQRESGGLNSLARYFIQFDPVLMILGIAGIGYSLWKRDLLVALWVLPFVFFPFSHRVRAVFSLDPNPPSNSHSRGEADCRSAFKNPAQHGTEGDNFWRCRWNSDFWNPIDCAFDICQRIVRPV